MEWRDHSGGGCALGSTMIFGTASTGEDVQKLTLSAGDLTISLLDWGAILQDVRLAGVDRSLTFGSKDFDDYEGPKRFHGSLIGPIANRISTSRVEIDGMMYELERNQDGRIHLHSGAQATHLRIWEVVAQSDHAATLRCTLMDGECGLPGNRIITATFTLTPPATLTLAIDATTDAATCMNFANHSYWNFDGSPTWEGHQLWIDADHYLPTDADACPTGEIADVTGTDMDFRAPRRIKPGSPVLDHNFCVSGNQVPLREVAKLTGQSGVGVKIATNQPGVQIYDGRDSVSNYGALAVECQGWPDAPNHAGFPSINVTPAAPYHQITRFTFFKPG